MSEKNTPQTQEAFSEFSNAIFNTEQPQIIVEPGNQPIQHANVKQKATLQVPFGSPIKSSSNPEIEITEEVNDPPVIYPLSTKEFELINFFNSYNTLYTTDTDQKELKDLINRYENRRGILRDLQEKNGLTPIESLMQDIMLREDPKNRIRLKLDPRPILAHMSPKMYMRFRKYQIEQIKDISKEITDFLIRLDLKKDEITGSRIIDNTPSKEINQNIEKLKKELETIKVSQEAAAKELEELKNNTQLEEALKKQEIEKKEAELKQFEEQITTIKDNIYKAFSEDPYYRERVKYYEKMHNLYKDITLEEKSIGNITEYSICYKDNNGQDIELSKMKIDTKQKTLVCEIPGGLDPSMQEKAALTQIDLLTRNMERSYDLKLNISGFANNPKMALRLYLNAAQQGFIVKIDESTLNAWKENLEKTKKELQELETKQSQQSQPLDEPDLQKIKKLQSKIDLYEKSLNYHESYKTISNDYENAYDYFMKHVNSKDRQNNFETAKKNMIQKFKTHPTLKQSKQTSPNANTVDQEPQTTQNTQSNAQNTTANNTNSSQQQQTSSTTPRRPR